MIALIKNILHILKGIYFILTEIKELHQVKQSTEVKLLNKHQVISLLKISDTTYRRYVKMGKLQPMRLHGIDVYYRSDLEEALLESRRKGRL